MISTVRYIHKPSGVIGVSIPQDTAKALKIRAGDTLWINWKTIIDQTDKILQSHSTRIDRVRIKGKSKK